MSGPGSGRYTNFTFTSDKADVKEKYNRLATHYNNRSEGKSQLYGIDYQKITDNNAAAKLVVSEFNKLISAGKGDPQMFPAQPVKMNFGDSPLISKNDKFGRIGDPSNAYVPNLASPGPAAGVTPVEPVAVSVNSINFQDLPLPDNGPGASQSPQVFSTSTGGSTGYGIISPDATAGKIGITSVGSDLTLGSYIKARRP